MKKTLTEPAMPEKDTPLSVALAENLRLRLMLSALPDPVPDSNWGPLYIQWWFRNRKRLRELGATTPDNVA
jgi:hypothetical protein